MRCQRQPSCCSVSVHPVIYCLPAHCLPAAPSLNFLSAPTNFLWRACLTDHRVHNHTLAGAGWGYAAFATRSRSGEGTRGFNGVAVFGLLLYVVLVLMTAPWTRYLTSASNLSSLIIRRRNPIKSFRQHTIMLSLEPKKDLAVTGFQKRLRPEPHSSS